MVICEDFKSYRHYTILENNYSYKKEIELFDSIHSGHPVQVIDKEELKKISKWKELLKKNSC